MADTVPHLQNYNLTSHQDEVQMLVEGSLGFQRLLIFLLLLPGYTGDHIQFLVEWPTEN